MTTYTITTAVNIDSLASKAGDDIYNVNGGYLTVDQDTRYGVNASTTGVPLHTTLSSSLGGIIEYNATKVRLIPYNGGSGNVPAYNTTISQGSASGLMIGVYANLTSAPTTPGSAMPASGYIKIKQWNQVAYTSGALTGLTANATGADIVGWLEIVGVEAGTITVNRLNQFIVRGDWYDLGTTTGNNSGTYQIPSNGSAVYCAGVQVETSAGSGVYEWYPCAGSLNASSGNLLTDNLGKVCWISTAGVVRFQNDGTNSGAGFLPASGLKIRVPNIFFTSCTTAAKGTNVVPNATSTTRPEFAMGGGAVVDIDKASVGWYFVGASAYSITLNDSCIFDTINLSNIGSPVEIVGNCVGQSAATAQTAFTLTFATFGGVITDNVFCRATLAGNATIATISGLDMTINNNKLFGLANRTGTSNIGAITFSNTRNISLSDNFFAGVPINISSSIGMTITDSTYSDNVCTASNWKTGQISAFNINSGCSDIKIDGVEVYGTPFNQAPASAFVAITATNTQDILVRNIGTAGSPIDTALSNVSASVSRTTTTATFTSTAHGLRTGDRIQVIFFSASVGSMATGNTYVITVTDANTFTITVSNTGGTSCTLTYKPVNTVRVIDHQSSNLMTNGHKYQRLYVEGCYANNIQTNFSNTDKNDTFENLYLGYSCTATASQFGMNDCTIRGVMCTRPTMTSASNVYGTHWGHFYFTPAGKSGWKSATWTRVTTTATVTYTNHLLTTASPFIVQNSSVIAAIPNGYKTTMTQVDADTFTFTCTNSGGTSGTLEWLEPDSCIQIYMCEPSENTVDQVNILSGSQVGFTSSGLLYMPNVSDSVEWIMPDYFLGITGFENVQPYLTGPTATLVDCYYAIDINDGNGFSSYKNLQYNRAGGSGTAGQFTFTVTSATGIAVGDYVYGTGIGKDAKVTNISSNTITVDVANAFTVSGVIVFNHSPNENASIDPALGIKLKVKMTINTATGTAISGFRIFTQSDATSRGYLYPLDLAELVLTDIVSGSDIVILEPGTDNEYANIDANGSSSYTFEYDAGEIPEIDIGVFKAGYVPFYIRNLSVSADGGSVPIAQIPDRNYVA